jgi:hypothetical protein
MPLNVLTAPGILWGKSFMVCSLTPRGGILTLEAVEIGAKEGSAVCPIRRPFFLGAFPFLSQKRSGRSYLGLYRR